MLTPREKLIVSLLAAGHTDADIAERLGLSIRTISYCVRHLMRRCGTRNRFQLGLFLGATGLLKPPSRDLA